MTPKRAVTIDDIAQAAGVSASTVSRVLNKSKPVNPATEAAVLSAVARLKFQPNVVAQGLARGKSTAIGVLTEDIASPFYGQILRGIEQGLHGSVYHPVFASTNWRPNQQDDADIALALLIGRRVDGLIVVGGHFPAHQLQAVASDRPLIGIGQTIAGFEGQCLTVENTVGARQITEHLIGLGHTRIAHITGLLVNHDAVERRAGYLAALEAAGITPDEHLIIEGGFTEEFGRAGDRGAAGARGRVHRPICRQ